MIEKVMFTNRTTAERFPGVADWAVISISEDAEAKLMDGWYAIHRVYFHDVDSSSSECNEQVVLMNDQHAHDIVDFVESVAPHVRRVLVHCKAGISRSAAVAKWVAERYDLPFDHGYALYNRHVYRLLIEAAANDRNDDGIQQ